MPKVSIIIPLHNKGAYIRETLESVCRQSHTDWETIVVENGSSDNGPHEVRAMLTNDSRIRLIEASDNVRGPGAARNLGIGHAQGEWVLFLDADDWIAPEYLTSLLQCADEMPDAVVVTSPWIERLAEAWNDKQEGTVKQPFGITTRGHGLEDSAIAFTCWAVHAAMIKRTWLLDRRWPEELDRYLAEDTAFWFRVVHGATVAYSQFPGAVYRTQTANCRSDFSADSWFEGNHRAVQCNLEYLRKLHKKVSSGQMESLIRLYSGLYRHSISVRNFSTADNALNQATMWLQHLYQDGNSLSYIMKLRMWIGIKSFERIKKILNS